MFRNFKIQGIVCPKADHNVHLYISFKSAIYLPSLQFIFDIYTDVKIIHSWSMSIQLGNFSTLDEVLSSQTSVLHSNEVLQGQSLTDL